MKAKRLLVAMALALGLPAGAQAGISFDPDGAGPLAPIDLAGMDWTQTSMLAINGSLAIQNFLTPDPTDSTNFDLLLHANLTATSDSSSTINTPTGLTSTYEITMVARFTENVTAIVPLTTSVTAFFETVTSIPGYLEFYFDDTPDANALTGSGFSDGRLILTATAIGASTGSFTTQGSQANPTIQLLDQFPNATAASDNYGDGLGGTTADQLTLVGSGSNSVINVGNILADPTFFLASPTTISLNFNNISQGLPYTSVDPSDCFTDNASGVGIGNTSTGQCANVHVDAPYSLQGVETNGGYVPNVLAVNGVNPAAGGGPDTVFQTDFNSAINGQAVPEPGSMALLGLGLGLAALVNSRRRGVTRV